MTNMSTKARLKAEMEVRRWLEIVSDAEETLNAAYVRGERFNMTRHYERLLDANRGVLKDRISALKAITGA